ncbi:MAG: molybdenum cofactor biosynthesis protein MoaE [Gemmatimonadales bacterium]
MRTALVTRPLNVDALLREVSSPEHGATAVFVGTVRSMNEGRQVRAIEYTAYEPMAEREMAAILDEAGRRNGDSVLVAEHRLGLLEVGEASIVIVAAHGHRSNALDALRYAIDEIKRRVPVWKRELFTDGSESWVDATRVAAS